MGKIKAEKIIKYLIKGILYAVGTTILAILKYYFIDGMEEEIGKWLIQPNNIIIIILAIGLIVAINYILKLRKEKTEFTKKEIGEKKAEKTTEVKKEQKEIINQLIKEGKEISGKVTKAYPEYTEWTMSVKLTLKNIYPEDKEILRDLKNLQNYGTIGGQREEYYKAQCGREIEKIIGLLEAIRKQINSANTTNSRQTEEKIEEKTIETLTNEIEKDQNKLRIFKLIVTDIKAGHGTLTVIEDKDLEYFFEREIIRQLPAVSIKYYTLTDRGEIIRDKILIQNKE